MAESRFSDARLLTFARTLQSAEDYDALLRAVTDEIADAIGYQTAWIGVLVPEANAFKILSLQGTSGQDIWNMAPLISIEGDAFIQELLDEQETVIAIDAQTDPRVNREVVEQLGNRTVINVPMSLIDEPFGVLGTGSFGDEGVREPSDDEIDYLERIAGQLVVASARILLGIERDESTQRQAELDQLLARRQRLESLGQLAGGIAHDFNNLLTVIRASAQMLRDDITDPAQRENLMLIERASISASEMTGRLLALGKRQQLHVAPLELAMSIDTVVEMFGRVVPSSVELTVEEHDELPNVLGDPGQIEQVLMNLFINASDAMPDGGRITVTAEPFEVTREFVHDHPWASLGNYVLITVADTGGGITDEQLERIFEPFYTTKPESEGSGLGLAVSRGIVEQHGGMINAYSEPGIGTSFKIYLPISDERAMTFDETTENGAVGGDERILIADDQDDVRRVIERILTRGGYEVVSVDNGLEAVDRVGSEAFDLVILDAVMPVMGGRTARQKIAELKPDLPAIFVTGYGGEELTMRVLGDQTEPLLAKPFDPALLLRTVRSSIDSRNEA